MRIWKRLGVGVGLAAAILIATPGQAQYRDRSTADRIAREIREAAEAIGTVRDAFDDSFSDIRWGGRDRDAIRMCAPRIERYGRMRVEDVRPYGRRSLRVYGTVDGGWDDRRYSSRSRYALRSFTCTVRDDGRVKVKTRRLSR